MAEIKVETIFVDGVRSPVKVGGAGPSGEAVVFVHGNPGASDDWTDLLAAVSSFARVVAPDMPGYGKADRPEAFEYTVAGYARHLDGILSQLGVTRAHLVLHDFGGPWGLQWAADHSDQVASLTLLNMGAMPGYRWHKFAKIWRTPILGELFNAMATRAAFDFLINADNPRPFPQQFIDRMFNDTDAGSKRAVLALYRATDDPGGLTTACCEKLAPKRLPALVLWGDSDKYLPVSYAELQRNYFDAQVHVLPRVGHWPMIDEPQRVRELIVPFLRSRIGTGVARTDHAER
jgi:pimeloyl-ACP methyl ester carboxylesterase